MGGEARSNIIDPRQLVRIEAVHRGFLHQHLYLANCLMRTPKSRARESSSTRWGGALQRIESNTTL